MTDKDDFGARDRPHLLINAFRERVGYSFPPRAVTPRQLRPDRAAHAAALLRQLAQAMPPVPPPDKDARLAMPGVPRGSLLELATQAPAAGSRAVAKLPSTLEMASQQITILRTVRTDDRFERAVLFVPDEARPSLRAHIQAYGRSDGDAGDPDAARFERVETICQGSALSLVHGTLDLKATQACWWELWVRGGSDRAAWLARQLSLAGLDSHAERLAFPDTTVLFAHASAADLLAFAARVPGILSAIRPATDSIELFLEPGVGTLGQRDFVEELAARILTPNGTASAVCTLDTGVAAGHPLIAPGLGGAWALDDSWGTDDHERYGGHGTPLAALVLYGDLGPLISDARIIELTHEVESMKLLPPARFPPTEPPAYGIVTQAAVALAEVNRPGVQRCFCLAVSAPDWPAGQPSSWSGALDQIAAGAMHGEAVPGVPAADRPKRLVLVATGNCTPGPLNEVTRLNPLEDPAQSWNALTIGGYTAKTVTPGAPAGLRPVAPAFHRSPYSRGSVDLPDDLTPIKPEVLFEAGNMVVDSSDLCGPHEAVSLLSAGSDTTTEPLVPFWATSAATGLAGNFLGRLQAELPERWPETLRALTVQSADWPQPLRRHLVGKGAHWRTSSKSEKRRILREVGYGIPDMDRALRSARNDVTMVAEAVLQPYQQQPDGRAVYRDMHFYDLPWPRVALERVENAVITMKVTLSYFIEPNLTGKAGTRPETYRSFGLRFAMKKRSESDAQFRRRINAAQEGIKGEAAKEPSHWLIGERAFQAGSLHCDLWRGHAVDLAAHDAIAIFPVGGWWKSHAGQRRMNDLARYALAITISAPGVAIDLHTEVQALIDAKVQALLLT